MFGRRQIRSHGELMRDELSEGFGHLWQAAAHAAGGVGATVGPKWESAKGHVPPGIGKARSAASHGMDTTMAAFLPLMDAARAGAASATRKARIADIKAGTRRAVRSRRRPSMLVGLLAAGAAVGAAGAMMARRRNRARWQEYESEAIGTARDTAKSALDSVQSTVDTGAQRVAGAAASAKDTANLFADRTAQATGTAAERANETAEQAKARADQLADQAASISKNSRG